MSACTLHKKYAIMLYNGGQTLKELSTFLFQAKCQLNQLYENACNASLDTGGDINENTQCLKGDEEVVVDMSVDGLELLGGDGNGSEDEADQMSDDEDDGIGAAWKEQNEADQMSDVEDDNIGATWEEQNKEGLNGEDVGQDSKCIAFHWNPWKETDNFKGLDHMPHAIQKRRTQSTPQIPEI